MLDILKLNSYGSRNRLQQNNRSIDIEKTIETIDNPKKKHKRGILNKELIFATRK